MFHRQHRSWIQAGTHQEKTPETSAVSFPCGKHLAMLDFDSHLVGGTPTPLKNHGVKVSWDDDIPNMMGKIQAMFQTTKLSSSYLKQYDL